MIHTMLCTDDHRLRHDLPRAEIGTVLANEHNLLWLDLDTPTPEDLRVIAAEFGFHPLAVEDATKQHQRPKIDRYDEYSFIVVYDIDYDEAHCLIDEHELDIFVGRNFLITVHYEPIQEIAEVAARFHRNTEQIERGVGVLLYSLLDTIVDHYFPVVDRVGNRIKEMEARVFESYEAVAIRDIFALKREMLDMRRVILPERQVLGLLASRELPVIGEKVGPYFQDVNEHVLRVTDTMDVYQDLLNGVIDSYVSLTSHHQAIASSNLNQVMKTLTSYSIILMSVTFIAGIYGMNFENMPELSTRSGYFVTLFVMALLGFALRWYFKRKGWL